jgi:hypothetical protein
LLAQLWMEFSFCRTKTGKRGNKARKAAAEDAASTGSANK